MAGTCGAVIGDHRITGVGLLPENEGFRLLLFVRRIKRGFSDRMWPSRHPPKESSCCNSATNFSGFESMDAGSCVTSSYLFPWHAILAVRLHPSPQCPVVFNDV